MLDDGAKDKGSEIEVKDVAQVIAESVGLDGAKARRETATEPS